MEGWETINTAPKDGTLIRVGWKEPSDTRMQEWFTMRWGHIQRNGLFPENTGMWVTPDGSMTWNGGPDDHGPTHWSPV
ncbi:hypothetical protein A3840_14850 [Devosia elaeis]|uniref:Uncharacterized protein n=1 Tax=Devosia elaeis TaxID=1770058 RepID=A0A178HQV5_9HYPH|nr:hypothetical protein A3840_14850 [Devosia elaeis]